MDSQADPCADPGIFVRGWGSRPDGQNTGSAHGTHTHARAGVHTHGGGGGGAWKGFKRTT